MAYQLVSLYSIDIGSVSDMEHTHNVRAIGGIASSIAIVWVILSIIILARYDAAMDKLIDYEFEYLCESCQYFIC